jgi:hypothetical protein
VRRAAIAAALVAALGGPARADVRIDPDAPDARTEAERFAAQAKVRFDAQDYEGAIAGYGAAYRRHPSPGLLFNLAQAHRLRGNCATASLMYHEYLRAVPDSPHRAVAERHLEALADCSHRQTLGGAAGTGGGISLARDDDPRPGRGKRVAGVAVGVAGIALVATGAYLMSDDDGGGGGGGWSGPGDDDDDDDDSDQPGRSELVGAGLIGAGVAAVATGTTLYLLGRRDDRESRRASISITPTKGGVAAHVGWRF